jgi:hypothetical protein
VIQDIKYVKIGEEKYFTGNSLAVFSTRNFSNYTSRLVQDLILKFHQKYIFYFTYDFYLRTGIYRMKLPEFKKVIVVERKFFSEKMLKSYSGIVVIDEYSQNKRINYLVKDLVCLNFVSKILILESTKFSQNLRILSEVAASNSIDVYCLPGKIYDNSSFGTNRMIFDGAIPLFDFDLLSV